jgi:hypothetical protein
VSYDVPNGLSGVKRDIFLHLCDIIGMSNNCLRNRGIRALLGMCHENFVWKTHSQFTRSRMKCFGIVNTIYHSFLFSGNTSSFFQTNSLHCVKTLSGIRFIFPKSVCRTIICCTPLTFVSLFMCLFLFSLGSLEMDHSSKLCRRRGMFLQSASLSFFFAMFCFTFQALALCHVRLLILVFFLLLLDIKSMVYHSFVNLYVYY